MHIDLASSPGHTHSPPTEMVEPGDEAMSTCLAGLFVRFHSVLTDYTVLLFSLLQGQVHNHCVVVFIITGASPQSLCCCCFIITGASPQSLCRCFHYYRGKSTITELTSTFRHNVMAT